MKLRDLAALVAITLSTTLWQASAQSASQWVADQSTLTYHVVHPMHEVAGTSHQARGKGVCQAGTCQFLIAVPVKSFGTGDSNRDLHMIETVRGAEYPMVVVHATFPAAELNQSYIHANVEVQFAGQTAHYANVPFQRTQQGQEEHIQGTLPLTCSDFKIERPSFLTVPIHNAIPVTVDMSWHPAK